VDFMHYAERLHDDAVAEPGHAEHEATRSPGVHSH
jgi:hypothetical protein